MPQTIETPSFLIPDERLFVPHQHDGANELGAVCIQLDSSDVNAGCYATGVKSACHVPDDMLGFRM